MEWLPAILVCSEETFLKMSNEPTASCPGNVHARSLTTTHCESAGRSVAKVDELERNTPHVAIPTPRFARKCSTRNPSYG